jgi:uncharacterized protein (TIGR03437 family)
VITLRPFRTAVTAAATIAVVVSFRASTQTAVPPPPVIYAVVNAASYRSADLAPGEVITIFGDQLGPDGPLVSQPNSAGKVTAPPGASTVLINGVSAPLLYVSRTQVTAVVPMAIDPGTPLTVRVDYLGITSTPQIFRMSAASPALFTATQTGHDQVAALNQDGSANSPTRPASPGNVVAFFVSGGGRTQPVLADGVIAGSQLRSSASPVTATVAGSPAEVVYAGSAPGLVSGIFQVNVRIPASTPSGNHVFVSLAVAGASTPDGATIAVANGNSALPDAPASFSALAGSSGVKLSWSGPSSAVRRVHIERALSDSGTFAESAAIDASSNSWTDSDLRPSATYVYRARFETPEGLSEYSTEGRADVPASYTPPPVQLTAAALSASSILLNWTNLMPGASAVIVERSTGGAFSEVARLGGSTSAWRDGDVSPGTAYSYRVRTVALSGPSVPSTPTDARTPTSARIADAPRLHPSDPHRLAIGGDTWTIAGYYPSLGAFTTDNTDYSLYQRMIDRMAANGINYFRVAFTMGQPIGNSINVYRRTGPGNAQDGRPKFDLTQFDQSYFDYWRAVVQYAQAKGIVVQLCMLDMWHASANVVENDGGPTHTWGLKYDYYYNANNINGLSVSSTKDLSNPANAVYGYQQALLRKIVDTLGDLPNVVWEIANESGQLPWELLHADTVTAYERANNLYEHLIVPRDLPGHQYVPAQCDNTPSVAHQGLVRAFPQNLVLITDNDCTDSATPDLRRGKAWAALTAGSQMDFFHFDLTQDSSLSSDNAGNGMMYVGLQRKFVSDLGVELAGMKPLDGDVTNGWALGRSGAEYVIYLPNGGSTSVPSLHSVSRAVWFNPRDGGSFDAGSGPDFRSPDGNDWVLYLLR